MPHNEAAAEDVPSLGDMQEIVDRLHLKDVVFLKLDAERTEPTETDAEKVQLRHQLLVRETIDQVHARVDSTISSPEATFKINALAIYEKTEPFSMEQGAEKEFLERVGIFAIWPYLRAQLHALCAGLSVDRVALPMIRQGQISVQAQEPQSDAPEESSEATE